MTLSDEELVVLQKVERVIFDTTNLIVKVCQDVDFADPSQFEEIAEEKRVELWDAFLERKDEIVDQVISQNSAEFDEEELEIVEGYREAFKGKFILLRELKDNAVFLQLRKGESEGLPPVFGVTALQESFGELLKKDEAKLPRQLETILFPFQGKMIFSGLLTHRRIPRGTNKFFADTCRESREAQGGLITGNGSKSTPTKKKTPKKLSTKDKEEEEEEDKKPSKPRRRTMAVARAERKRSIKRKEARDKAKAATDLRNSRPVKEVQVAFPWFDDLGS